MAASISDEMNPTRRNTMEDVHVFHRPGTWKAPDQHATFIGVYDGHGGRGTVDYLEDNLSENVAKEWRYSVDVGEGNENSKDVNENDGGNKRRKLEDDAVKTTSSDDSNNDEGLTIRTALERAFLLTDIHSRMDGIQTSGATVACCIVVPKFNDGTLDSIMIHCANAGDARIVLSNTTARLANSEASNALSTNETKQAENNETAVRLTHDHKATDPEEITRIQNSGGIMLRGRVLGVLAVARSLGDHGLKEFVIGRPHLSSTVVKIEKNRVHPGSSDDSDKNEKSAPLTNGEFLIVACDGLWDVIEDQEAVNLVRDFVHDTTSIHSAKSRQEKVARSLIDEALRRGSTDNITVIVYWL